MRRRTKIGALGSAGLIAIALFSPLSATADIEGTLTAGADADLVEVSGVSLPPGCGDEAAELFGLDAGIDCTFQLGTLRAGDTETGNSTAANLSNGIEDGLVSFGHASNFDGEALTAEGVEGNLAGDFITEANAFQLGGPTEDSDQLGALPENPLVAADAATVNASATDISEGNTQCPEGNEIRLSHGFNELANLVIGPGQADGGDVVAVEGVSFALSQVDLVDALVDGEGYGIRSSAAADLKSTSLLNGNLTLDVIQPRLVGTHDGESFSFEYTAPDVVLTAGGETIEDGDVLDQLDAQLLEPLLTGLEPITDGLEPLLKVNLEIKDTDDVEVAGNSATVSDVVLLEIVLLSGAEEEGQEPIEVLSLSIGDLSVSAEAPEGGVIIDCANPPLTVEKDGPESAEPGETFTYTIDVTNETGCDATEVVVTDEITGPDGFEVVGTSPSADSVEGGTVTWNVGDMADGETQTFTVDVTVPDSATAGDMFEDTATAAGNCDGRALPLGSDTLEGPAVQTAAARTQSLPRTGGGFALLGIAAAAGAGFLRRR